MLPLEAGFEFAFATARTFVFRGFEATARAVLRSVDYMSLMLFYMANSFHLARTPKLRLAHHKRPAPPPAAGPLHLIRFSLEQTSLRAGEVARFGVRQIDRSFLALICATLNVFGPEQIAGSGGMMGCYDTG